MPKVFQFYLKQQWSFSKSYRPVILEVPHYASLRGKEREIVILRSDNGTSWREHNADATDDVVQDILHETLEIEGRYLPCNKNRY